MIAIDQHISQLLFTHECVIIPGFGAFVLTPISAKINTEKNILLPPSKEIGFNRSLSHNDGLLISTYAQASNVSYASAKVNIENYTALLKEQINSGNTINLSDIGSIKADINGNLQFTASNTTNYCKDSFGLGSFHFAPELQIKHTNENLQVKRVLKPLKQRHIAATVALLVGLFAISPDVNNEFEAGNMNTAGTIDFTTTNNSLHPENSYRSDAASFIEESESLPEEEAITAINKNQFYLIAGSFNNESQAERFLKQIHNKGERQAFILHSPNNRFRIALNGFEDKGIAIQSMRNYRKQKDFKTVWVMKQ